MCAGPTESWRTDNGEPWQREESEKWIRGMSEGGVSLQPSLSGKVHSSFSRLRVTAYTLAIARSVAMKTRRIDEVQAGVGWQGFGEGGAEMVKPDVG